MLAVPHGHPVVNRYSFSRGEKNNFSYVPDPLCFSILIYSFIM